MRPSSLEALHPGELGRILTEEVERYHDSGLQDRIDEVESEVDEELDEINAEVHDEHEAQIESFRTRYAALVKQARERIKAVESEICEQFEALGRDMKPCWDAIANSLDGRFDFDSVDWPEPDEGDEDDDPLFDSTRDYVEQIDRYKEHQDKPTERRKGVRGGSGWKAGRRRGPMSEEQKEARRRTWARKLGKDAAE